MKKVLYTAGTVLFLAINGAMAQAPAIEWQKSFGGTEDEVFHSVQQTSDGGYIAAGYTWSIDGDVSGRIREGKDIWVVKTNSSGTIEWQRTIGSSGLDEAHYIQQTSDGGYILAGEVSANDGDVSGYHPNEFSSMPDAFVAKLSSDGTIEWTKTLGGQFDEVAYCIQQTTDGGYIMSSHAISSDGDVGGSQTFTGKCWVVKLSNVGNIVWTKEYMNANGVNSFISQTSDQGYILATGEDVVIKLDNAGNTVWEQSYGEYITSARQTSDGGYILSGRDEWVSGNTTGNHGSFDYTVIKLDNAGNKVWQKELGGTKDEGAWGGSQQTADGGYIVCGYTQSTNGDITGAKGVYDFWVVKLSGTGNIVWQKILGGSNSDFAYGIDQTSDGGYIVVGGSSSTDGDVIGGAVNGNSWIVKLAPDTAALTTSVNNLAEKTLSIYPNPSNGIYTITSDITQGGTVEVYNVTGIQILSQTYSSLNKATINIANQAKGIYLVKVSDKENVWTQRVVLK